MTLRLVALMSVVLLLSLASFALLMTYSQDQVMAEVARTASDVGQATLRTLDFAFQDPEKNAVISGVDKMVWHSPEGPLEELHAEAGQVIEFVGEKTEDVKVVTVMSKQAVTDSDIGHLKQRREMVAGEDGEWLTTTCESDDSGGENCITTRGPTAERFFIRIPDVRAESDPADGLVLEIPRFTHEVVAEAVAFGVDDAGNPLHADVLRTPISVAQYDELFDRVRGRSLLLFFGVFLVGSVLSAGLATRFTRPIRRLDSGLRRLSDGDLDVEVDVRGKDEIARLAGAFNEMTGRLRSARDQAEDLARKEKLSSLGRLAAGVAHDVRNPLHSIGLTLDHLRETGRPVDPERAGEFDRSLTIIRGEIRRLDALVANFLRFARSDRAEPGDVDLGELLRETERLVRKEAEWRGIDLTLEVDESVPRVRADEESLRASILNLVINSFEAMSEGGRLTLQLTVQGGEAVVEVADNGCGIPEEDQEKVFDFAYTTRSGGNGLGLAMVHQYIAVEHGGRVILTSSPGEGTRVQLALPVNKAGESES